MAQEVEVTQAELDEMIDEAVAKHLEKSATGLNKAMDDLSLDELAEIEGKLHCCTWTVPHSTTVFIVHVCFSTNPITLLCNELLRMLIMPKDDTEETILNEYRAKRLAELKAASKQTQFGEVINITGESSFQSPLCLIKPCSQGI